MWSQPSKKNKIMALPNVSVTRTQANTGVFVTTDSVAGLILSGVAVSGLIALNQPKRVFELADAEALGLTAAYDVTNTVKVHKQISDFYEAAGRGKELWIMLVEKTVTLTEMADVDEVDKAIQLINASEGRITLLGVTRTPPNAYSPTVTDGIDPDVITALAKAQELATTCRGYNRPITVLVEGRGVEALDELPNLRTNAFEDVACVIGNNVAGATYACVGLALGRLAATGVHESLGKRLNGAASTTYGGFSNGSPVSDYSPGLLDTLHDNGYIFLVPMQGFSGYFWSGSPNCASASSSVNNVADSRTWAKAARLAYQAYAVQIDNNVAVTATGRIEPAIAKVLEAEIERVINLNMAESISSVKATIDLDQNVRDTEEVTVALELNKLGRLGTINVKLGFAVNSAA